MKIVNWLLNRDYSKWARLDEWVVRGCFLFVIITGLVHFVFSILDTFI